MQLRSPAEFEIRPPAIAQTMKAATVTAPKTVDVAEVSIPQPGLGQVRVRLEGCGVCASNVTPWQGAPWMTYPTEPGGLGHEGWGVVDALGPGVKGLAAGDRVATLFQHSYAEYDVGDATSVVKLPSSLDGRPFPGEPLGCAMNIFRRSGIAAGQTVAIVGVGFLGALLTRLASVAGARVIAVSRRPTALAIAEAMGAWRAVELDDAAVAAVGEATGSAGCDVVIEATGKQRPLDLAGELVRERGQIVIAGYHQDGPRQVNLQQWNWKGVDVINAHERNPAIYMRGMREAVAAVESGLLDPAPLLTHSYPLSGLSDALAATRDRPEGFMKALVTM